MTTYADHILGRDDLISFWKMGETSGTTMVDAKAAHGGTYSGGFTLNQLGALGGNDDDSPAVAFNGTSGLATVSDGSALNFIAAGSSFSISCLVKAGAIGDALFLSKADFVGGYGLGIDTSGNVFAALGTSRVNGPVLTLGTWHHLVLTYTAAGGGILYLDGVEVASRGPDAYQGSTANLTIASGYGAFFAHATMHMAAIYGRALAPIEIEGDAALAFFSYPSTERWEIPQLLNAPVIKRRMVVNDSDYTIKPSDLLVAVTALTAARTLTLPNSGLLLTPGQELVIQDESGGVAAHNITLSGPINGGASALLTTDYVRVVLTWDGSKWVQAIPNIADLGIPSRKLADLARTGGWLPTNAISQNSRRDAVASTVTLTSGLLYLAGGLVLPGGRPVSAIHFLSGTGATTPTHQWFCLLDKSRNLLATTIDDLTTAWGNNTDKGLQIATALRGSTPGGTYTPASAIEVYVGVMVTAATPPTLRGTAAGTQVIGIPPILSGTADSGLSTLASAPTTAAALTALAQLGWCYVT